MTLGIRGRLAVVVAAVVTLSAPAGAGAAGAGEASLPDGPLRASDYLAFADRLQDLTDRHWSEARGRYANPSSSARINAEMLAVHSLAALAGHDGPARRDDRARRLAAAFTRRPAFVSRRDDERPQPHRPGWAGTLTGGGMQHVALSAQVAEALALAHRARREIGLDAAVVRRIRTTVRSVARSPFFRPSRVRLNQFVWQAMVYAADAEVTGSRRMLTGPYRSVLAEFARHARRAARGMRTSNLNSGFGLRYAPQLPAREPVNASDTAEYASLNLAGIAWYSQARRRGMRGLGGRAERVFRRWAARVVRGSWAHAGVLNWDTGLGQRRWHLSRYWAWAQRGLIAVAAEPRLGGAVRRHAAALLDESLRNYERWADSRMRVPSLPYGLRSGWSNRGDAALTAARFQGGALRAAISGLGSAAKGVPTAVFAHDADIGRLAISTRRYSTAIVAPNRAGGGGIDLARLHDARARALGGPGGTGRARSAFGLRVTAGGTAVLETQPGRPSAVPGGQILGRVRVSRARTNRSGAFSSLTARASARSRAARVSATHRFSPDSIATAYRIRPARRGLRADLRVPTPRGADIRAVDRSGGTVRLTGRAVPASRVASIEVRTADGGALRVRMSLPRGARILLAGSRATPSDRRPGPAIVGRFRADRPVTARIALRPGA